VVAFDPVTDMAAYAESEEVRFLVHLRPDLKGNLLLRSPMAGLERLRCPLLLLPRHRDPWRQFRVAGSVFTCNVCVFQKEVTMIDTLDVNSEHAGLGLRTSRTLVLAEKVWGALMRGGYNEETHSTFMGYLLWVFGFTGAHRFYYGRPISGTIYFFTLGLLLIGWIVDLFLIPSMERTADCASGPVASTIPWPGFCSLFSGFWACTACTWANGSRACCIC
jgi:Predicted membrane protein